jgi:predicted TIM-barrel fold metal-dependent hydrolase
MRNNLKTLLLLTVLIVLITSLSATNSWLIDAHAHFFNVSEGPRNTGSDYDTIARKTIAIMDQNGITTTVIMPHPFTKSQRGIYTEDDYINVLKKYPDRFVWLGGGGTLNVMIHSYKNPSSVTDAVKLEFTKAAELIITKGARGFGEIALEHFSMRDGHPYESVPADHPLVLALADIAAQKGVPIEIHMEAISADMAKPEKLTGDANPSTLKANIQAFERLLDHNPRAVIIWAHVGWDNTGLRTPDLTRTLMERHPNLMLDIKFGKDASGNPLINPDQSPKAEWLSIMEQFQDRIMFASDQFYTAAGITGQPERISSSVKFMNSLSAGVASKVGYENAQRVYKISSK